MKGSRWFIVFVVAFLFVMFAIEYHLPKSFVWKPIFGHHGEQPFGCAVFDSVSPSSLPQGYTFSRKSLYQLEQEDTTQRKGTLVISDNLRLSDVDVDALLRVAECGDRIMLVSTLFGRYLEDILQFRSYHSYFSPMALKKYATSFMKKGNLRWIGGSTIYPRQTFYFYPQLCSSYSWGDSLPERVLVQRIFESSKLRYETKADSLITDSLVYTSVMMPRRWGEGEAVSASTPLIFTNCGTLDGKNTTYIFRLLSQMGKLPIARTEGYVKETAQVQQSPFCYLLMHQPFHWALYLTMITIIFFIVFTAEGRQQVIPVIHGPANKSLEFTEPIGALYFRKKDHAGLVRRKFSYLAEELRRGIQVDIEEVAGDEHSFHWIARKTGVDTREIAEFIREVRPVIYGGRVIDTEQMKVYIDKMNEIINHI